MSRVPGFTQVIVGKEFPMQIGELIRVRLGQGKELRVSVRGEIPLGDKAPIRKFLSTSKLYTPTTNKEGISMVGNERRIPKLPMLRGGVANWKEEL